MISPVASNLFASPLYLSLINGNLQNNASYVTNAQQNVD
jgi:hypothetical protein